MQHSIQTIESSFCQTECALFGSGKIRTRTEDISFPYGSDDSSPILRAAIPVHTCEDCGLEFTNHDADIICHDTVCRHLGVPTLQNAMR